MTTTTHEFTTDVIQKRVCPDLPKNLASLSTKGGVLDDRKEIPKTLKPYSNIPEIYRGWHDPL